MEPDLQHKPDLQHIREQLDEIDRQVIQSLAARQRIIRQTASLKENTGAPVCDPAREQEILERLRELARASGLDDEFVQTLFREILDHSVRYQTDRLAGRLDDAPPSITVAYQGVDGAFSHQAARRHFSARGAALTCRGYATFRAALEAVVSGEATCALLPVENTTAGSITKVYDLLAETELTLVGEEVLRVEHCLMTAMSVPLSQIRRVISHPQALAQCSQFLEGLPGCEAVPFADTALAAEEVRRDADPAQAAIASREAARRYGLHIVQRDIANQEENYTRFVVAAREPAPCETRVPCKTSLLFATPHEKGALVRCLKVLDAHGINLTKLESRPRPHRPWEYLFFVDLEGHAEEPSVGAALEELRTQANHLKVFGSYPAHGGRHPTDEVVRD